MSSHAPPTPLADLLAHREWVKRLALRLAGDEHSAEDLAQDAWLAALRHPPRRDGVRAWFGTVLRHRSRNVHRSETRRDARETERGPRAPERSAADVVAEADAHRHVVDEVMDLDEPYRTALVLRYFEQFPVQEVARRTGAPLETVRARLRRGRERLRKRLDGEFGSRAAWCVPLLAGWPGIEEAAPTGAVASTAAATLVGGLIVNKLLLGAAAAGVLIAGGLWLGRGGSEPDPKAAEETAEVEPERAARPGRRDRDAGESEPAKTEPEETPAADVPEDPVAAFRRTIEALPHRTVTGIVTDLEGRPVPGASVFGGSATRPLQDLTATDAEAGAGTEARAVPVTAAAIDPMLERYSLTVDPDGTFAMDIPVQAKLPDPKTEVFLWANADGFAPTRVLVPAGVEHFEFRMARAVLLRVRVLDSRGGPVAGRQVRVSRDMQGGGDHAAEPTDEDGWTTVHHLPAGSLVRIRVNSETRMGGLREMVRLPEQGETEVILRDDGKRRVEIAAAVSDPSVPVSALLVQHDSGQSELRPWPGGTRATFELPDQIVQLRLVTALGQGELVSVGPDQGDVALSVDIPPHRWIEVDLGGIDPEHMDFSGMANGSLAYAPNLTTLTENGLLRLPLVEGGEYALRTPDWKYRLIGWHAPDRFRLDAPQQVVGVRIVSSTGGALPPGTRIVADPQARGVRSAQAKVEAGLTKEGFVALDLVPGITYGITVSAPGMASDRLDHKPGTGGGDVQVTLAAGEPLRIAVSGLATTDKTSIVTFPDFGRIDTRIEDGHIVLEGVADVWLLVMVKGRVFLVNAAKDAKRSIPDGEVFTPDARADDARGRRMFLIGTTPLSDGVHPVGLVGAPLGIPAGRYVPIEWSREEVVVHAPVDLDAASPTWVRPADDEVEWTRGEHTGDALSAVAIGAGEVLIPIGMLGRGKASSWRSAGPQVTIVER